MYKTMLQEMCQKRRWKLPEYSTVRDGPNHNVSFTATVMVNGVTFSTPQPCRSTKEAQNMAANIAYATFTAADQQQAGVSEFPPQRHGDLSLVNAGNEEHVGGQVMGQSDDPIPIAVQHIYKNKLQQYAQKNNLSFPVYKNEFDGPPHARRFRSTVSVGGKEYKSDEFFSTLKDAEQAAAQNACQNLSVDLNHEDAGLYKNLLQELTQKKGLVFPTYDTTSSGLSHNLSFSSTVEVQGCKFKGPEAKNKKQAETMAAKVAYLALTEGQPVASDMSQDVQLTTQGSNDSVKTNEVPEAENQLEEPSITQTTTMSISSQLLPDVNLASGDSVSGYYQLRSPVDAHAVEIISNGENSKTLIVRRDSNYQIPTGAVVKTCDDEWVAYEIIG